MRPSVRDAMELSMVHEEVDPLHSTSLFLIVSEGASESPISCFISTRRPYLIPLARKGIKFSGSDVDTQITIDGIENVAESHITAIRGINVNYPRQVY